MAAKEDPLEKWKAHEVDVKQRKDAASSSIVEDVQMFFYGDDSLQEVLQKFYDEHAEKFCRTRKESKVGHEYTLRHTEVYQDYCALLEKELEAYIFQRGLTVKTFYERLEGDLKAHNEDSAKADTFVSVLQAVRRWREKGEDGYEEAEVAVTWSRREGGCARGRRGP